MKFDMKDIGKVPNLLGAQISHLVFNKYFQPVPCPSSNFCGFPALGTRSLLVTLDGIVYVERDPFTL